MKVPGKTEKELSIGSGVLFFLFGFFYEVFSQVFDNGSGIGDIVLFSYLCGSVELPGMGKGISAASQVGIFYILYQGFNIF
jgi:hypothetical protein